MKPVTRYQAYTGRIFETESKCAKYEKGCRRAEEIATQLSPLPKNDGCRFVNGHGCIQHDKDMFLKVRRELLELANKEMPHPWFNQALENESVDPSWPGRLIGESDNDILVAAWHRIECTDKQFREWGQPFFVRNPDKAENQDPINTAT